MNNNDEEDTPEFPKPPVDTTGKDENKRKKKKINQNENKSNNWDAFQNLLPPNVKSALSVEGKSLVNWENRTLKTLKSNRIFGGQLKDEAVKEYINSLDAYKLVEQNDPFTV